VLDAVVTLSSNPAKDNCYRGISVLCLHKVQALLGSPALPRFSIPLLGAAIYGMVHRFRKCNVNLKLKHVRM
jgi:hypothetical protein